MGAFRNFMEGNLDDYIEDIANQGASRGFPHLTYYDETGELYDKYSEEIWDALYEDTENFGNKNVLELIASFGGADDVGSDEQFKNLLVWYMAERTAREIMDERDEDEDEDEDED